jgi:hypothetical protein
MNAASAARPEKKMLPMGDFFKLMPIFSGNNFVNPFKGGSLISCTASVRQGFPSRSSELAYLNREYFLQLLS